MNVRLAAVCLVLVGVQACAGQVVFSRRVYRKQGHTYPQIWEWNPATGALRQITKSPRAHLWPVCKNGGRQIQFVRPEEARPNDQLWEFNRATGGERMIAARAPEPPSPAPGKECDQEAKSGSLRACGKGDNLTIARGGKIVAHLKLGTVYEPIESLRWSADARWLLVETLGADTSSTSPQSDYHIVDAGGRQTIAAGSGSGGAWIPGRDEIFFTTPRDLAPLPWTPRHTAWVERLVVFNVATRKTVPVTTGFSDDMDPAACRR